MSKEKDLSKERELFEEAKANLKQTNADISNIDKEITRLRNLISDKNILLNQFIGQCMTLQELLGLTQDGYPIDGVDENDLAVFKTQ